MNKTELKRELTNRGVPFEPKATNEVLEGLLEANPSPAPPADAPPTTPPIAPPAPEDTNKVEVEKEKGPKKKVMTKKKFAELIEAYKKRNPVKYAQKKEALEKQLSTYK